VNVDEQERLKDLRAKELLNSQVHVNEQTHLIKCLKSRKLSIPFIAI
jgi:hypothetical protein